MMRFLVVLSLGFLLLPSAARAETYGEACNKWLGLVDAGKYDESWDAASAYFKSKITKEQWAPLVKAVRDAVGQPLSRKASQVTPADILPEAPFGKYLVVVLKTKFQMNENVTETVILKQENEEWRVAGYFIK